MKKVMILVCILLAFSLSSCSLFNKQVEKRDIHIKEKVSFRMKVNSTSVYINGQESILDVPVKEIDGHTLVPLKFIADFLKAENVYYDDKTEEVTFTLEH
jgi:hypothetical protein